MIYELVEFNLEVSMAEGRTWLETGLSCILMNVFVPNLWQPFVIGAEFLATGIKKKKTDKYI